MALQSGLDGLVLRLLYVVEHQVNHWLLLSLLDVLQNDDNILQFLVLRKQFQRGTYLAGLLLKLCELLVSQLWPELDGALRLGVYLRSGL